MRSIVLLTALALTAACGSQGNDKAAAPAPKAPVAEQTPEKPAELPAALVVKVPVGADGQEIPAQAEFKTLSTLEASEPSAVASSFDAGTAVTVADELDADTSSQQWGRGSWYWNTPWYPGKLLGRGLWWGRNPYVYYGGYSYPYGGYNYYSYGGYNYRVYGYGSGYGCSYSCY